MLNEKNTYVYDSNGRTEYPQSLTFSPSEEYPEYPFGGNLSAEFNHVYDGVRNILKGLGFDKDRYGRNDWNPLGEIIKHGDTVLIKPNFVRDFHEYGWDMQSVITHGSVIRAILDYVFIALRNSGRIIIGDAPLQDSNFDRILSISALDKVISFYKGKGIYLEIVDFRSLKAITDKHRYILSQIENIGDPRGYADIDLGSDSLLNPISGSYPKFRVTNYDPKIMGIYHGQNKNKYVIANTVLTSDVIINIPKIKTHRLSGITVTLKNLVGINGNKDCLAHYRRDSIEEGGDEYQYKDIFKRASHNMEEKEFLSKSQFSKNFFRFLRRVFNTLIRLHSIDPFRGGSWYGNDTVWRTVLDINRILHYSDKTGKLRENVQRRVFNLVDGIVSGEKDGPLKPSAKYCGIMIGGLNPVAVEAVAARMMGFDYKKIPTIFNSFNIVKYPLCNFNPSDINVYSNHSKWNGMNIESGDSLKFEPHKGWKGHIELDS